MQNKNYLVTLGMVKFSDNYESEINYGTINLRLEPQKKDLVYGRKEEYESWF